VTVPPRTLLLLAVGFTLWSSALVSLYSVHAIGCAFAWPPAVLRAILLSLATLHLVALAWMSLWCWRRWRSRQEDAPRSLPFLEFVGLGATIAALGATLFTVAPALVLNLCS